MQARRVRSGAVIGLAALTAGLALVVGASAQDGAERKQPGAVGNLSGQTPAQSEQAQRAPIAPSREAAGYDCLACHHRSAA